MGFALTALAGLIVLAVAVMLIRRAGAESVAGGVTAGSLAPCPQRPNCVSSQAGDELHAVEALRVAGAEPLQRIKDALSNEPSARLIEETDGYLHYVFTTRLWRFQDDVELLLDRQAGVVHIRSASRIGYSDLGANRKRVEWIRDKLL